MFYSIYLISMFLGKDVIFKIEARAISGRFTLSMEDGDLIVRDRVW